MELLGDAWDRYITLQLITRLIHTKMKTSASELLNKESQAELIAQIKKVFASGNVTAEEFPR